MDCCGDMLQQGLQGHSQSSFRIDSFHMFSIARTAEFAVIRSYLFTFWPPGPDDLLKVNSPMLWRGIASACSIASHVRAARSSSSLLSLSSVPLADDAKVRCTAREGLLVMGTRARRTAQQRGACISTSKCFVKMRSCRRRGKTARHVENSRFER